MTDKPPYPPQSDTDAPRSPGRRSMLLGLGAAGGGASLATLPGEQAAAEEAGSTGHLSDRVSYLGAHQAGVTTDRPPMGLVLPSTSSPPRAPISNACSASSPIASPS